MQNEADEISRKLTECHHDIISRLTSWEKKYQSQITGLNATFQRLHQDIQNKVKNIKALSEPWQKPEQPIAIDESEPIPYVQHNAATFEKSHKPRGNTGMSTDGEVQELIRGINKGQFDGEELKFPAEKKLTQIQCQKIDKAVKQRNTVLTIKREADINAFQLAVDGFQEKIDEYNRLEDLRKSDLSREQHQCRTQHLRYFDIIARKSILETRLNDLQEEINVSV